MDLTTPGSCVEARLPRRWFSRAVRRIPALPSPWPQTKPSFEHCAAYRDAEPVAFWQDTLPRRDDHPPLEGVGVTGLAIVGGGFTGLWAALYAKELDPARSVTVLEAARCGSGASSRNGGFLQASLTHGLANGESRFADELEMLEAVGLRNFNELRDDLERYGIDAEYESSGDLSVALVPHELNELREAAELASRYGHDVSLLDEEATQAELRSPTFLGGLWDRTGSALINPAKLADGLRRAALSAGVEIHEHSAVTRLQMGRSGVTALTKRGRLQAERVLLATSAYPTPLRRVRPYIAPVYDYALMTEPLSEAQLEAVGWRNRQGVSDCGNQFHYYRLSADNRILWGGYEAVYRYGGPVRPDLDTDELTFAKLSQHFHTTFPMLSGIRFSHAWGGAIDTCSRFSVFFGTAGGGRIAYALGYTGLGVAASRFGGRTALDLVDGRVSEASELQIVRRRPLPFPPEPLKSAVIQLTRNRLAAADRNDGRRGIWLQTLDRFGLGFDS